MKPRAPHAPVVTYYIDFTDLEGTAPDEIWDGSGTTDIVMCAFNGVIAGVLFGSHEGMDLADSANSFPVGADWVKTTIGPATRFISVIALDGNGTLFYYFPGQTEPV
jgi:hypothetical protein